SKDQVHDRPGQGDQDFGARRNRGQTFGRLALALERLRTGQLGQGHETSRGNQTQGVSDTMAGPAEELGAEANGETLDLEAAPARHTEMSEFVNAHRRAEEQHDRHDYISPMENLHLSTL